MHDRLPALPQPLVSTKALRLCALRAPQAHYDADDVAMVDGIVRADDASVHAVASSFAHNGVSALEDASDEDEDDAHDDDDDEVRLVSMWAWSPPDEEVDSVGHGAPSAVDAVVNDGMRLGRPHAGMDPLPPRPMHESQTLPPQP